MNDSLVHWAGGTITFSACFSSNFGSSPQILHPTQVDDEPVPIPGAAWGNPQPQACPGAMPSVSPFSSRQDLCSSQKYLLFWAFSLSVCCLKGAWQNSLFRQGLAFSVIFFFFSDSYNWKWFLPTSPRHLFGWGEEIGFPSSFILTCCLMHCWSSLGVKTNFHTFSYLNMCLIYCPTNNR